MKMNPIGTAHSQNGGTLSPTDHHSLITTPLTEPSPIITPMKTRPSNLPCAFLNTPEHSPWHGHPARG